MSEQIKGWLLSAKDAPAGVEFEEFYVITDLPVEITPLHFRIAQHLATYPDVPLYLVEATKITGGK